MKEVAEAMWRLFNIYCTRIGITTVRKLHNFEMMVESMINSNLERGKLLSVKVGGIEFVWLEEEEWPDKREQERMENYRTVNQAVRVVMEVQWQQLVSCDSGGIKAAVALRVVVVETTVRVVMAV